ncbi:MAG: hypothetical protein GQ477_02645 [Nanohaloarchaea archaeon]|nr:hypothetical protein [Candidatus Nanohaloarchaea archaeon]
MAEKRLYTIPLRDAWNSSIKKRSKRAMSVIRIFAERHMKTESVKIGSELNHHIWVKGIKNPPRKVKVQMVPKKTGDTEVVWVDLATSSMDYLKDKKDKKAKKVETDKKVEKATEKDKTKDDKTTVKKETPAQKTSATETKKETEATPKTKAETKDAVKETKSKAEPKAAPKAKAEAEAKPKPKATKKAAPAKK